MLILRASISCEIFYLPISILLFTWIACAIITPTTSNTIVVIIVFVFFFETPFEPLFYIILFNNLTFSSAKVMPFYWKTVTKTWQRCENVDFFDTYQDNKRFAVQMLTVLRLQDAERQPGLSVLEDASSFWAMLPFLLRTVRDDVPRNCLPCFK